MEKKSVEFSFGSASSAKNYSSRTNMTGTKVMINDETMDNSDILVIT